jgi:hypothetical protein
VSLAACVDGTPPSRGGATAGGNRAVSPRRHRLCSNPWALRQAYALAPAASFSRAVLGPCPSNLAVSRLPTGVNWSDLGTPDRVVQSLRAAGLRPPCLRRFEAHPPRWGSEVVMTYALTHFRVGAIPTCT